MAWRKTKDGSPTESQVQMAIVSWAKLHENQYPKLRMLFHVTNQGKRSWRLGKEFKAMGMKKGVSDLILLAPSREYHFFCLEVKRKGEKPTKEQLEFLTLVDFNGGKGQWCDSVDEGILKIKSYLGIK